MRHHSFAVIVLGLVSCSEDGATETANQPSAVGSKYVFELRGPRGFFTDHVVKVDGTPLTATDVAAAPDQVLFRTEFSTARVEDLPLVGRELRIDGPAGTASVIEPLRANRCIGYASLTSEVHQYELIFGDDGEPQVRLGCYDCVAGEYGSLTCRQYSK